MLVLLPDTWHFHQRNFASLFAAFDSASIPVIRERSRRHWWKCHGDYTAFADLLASHLKSLERVDPATAEVAGIPLWSIAKSEFLCRVLPRPRWSHGAGANTAEAVLARAQEDAEDLRDLMLCLAAARDWVLYWDQWLAERPKVTHALAFSGSYIYTRALHEVARRRGLRCFGLETFFTGNEFYFEERATPLPNNSLLGDPAWRDSLALPDDCDALRAVAHSRLRQMRNKNVRAVPKPLAPFWSDGRPTVLVIGQVLNDFSLIETEMPEVSSLAVYRDLISGLLVRTNANVVFKAHPWERKRPNLRRPLTLDALGEFAAALPDDHRSRLRLAEAEAITSLFPIVDHVVGLCSQGMLEACQAGFKPGQLGRAFFGGQGFTHDFATASEYVTALAGGLGGGLDLEGYRRFEDFLVRALLMHLVRNDIGGAESLVARLGTESFRPTCQPAQSASEAERPRLASLLREIGENPLPWLRDGLRWLGRRLSGREASPPR